MASFPTQRPTCHGALGHVLPPKGPSGPYLFGALQVSGQAHEEVVGDGVHQVEEGGLLVEHVTEERPLQAKVL